MVDLTTADHTAISSAIWSHPQGVSFNAKLTQIAECCHNMGRGHSGVTRLWMHELYAKSIEEDHKKRGINQPEPVVVVATRQPTTKKAKIKRITQPTVKLTPNHPHKPLPYYAPAFVRPVNAPSIVEYLAELAPLPRLSLVPNVKPIKITEKAPTPISIKKKKQREEEYLLLMVA